MRFSAQHLPLNRHPRKKAFPTNLAKIENSSAQQPHDRFLLLFLWLKPLLHWTWSNRHHKLDVHEGRFKFHTFLCCDYRVQYPFIKSSKNILIFIIFSHNNNNILPWPLPESRLNDVTAASAYRPNPSNHDDPSISFRCGLGILPDDRHTWVYAHQEEKCGS